MFGIVLSWTNSGLSVQFTFRSCLLIKISTFILHNNCNVFWRADVIVYISACITNVELSSILDHGMQLTEALQLIVNSYKHKCTYTVFYHSSELQDCSYRFICTAQSSNALHMTQH